jgi:hypothetical protein
VNLTESELDGAGDVEPVVDPASVFCLVQVALAPFSCIATQLKHGCARAGGRPSVERWRRSPNCGLGRAHQGVRCEMGDASECAVTHCRTSADAHAFSRV